MKIAVIYDSYRGHTKAMAREVATGAASVEGAEVRTKSVEEAAQADLQWADGIAVGCPTHMGSPAWRMKKFIDEVFGQCWLKFELVGKVGTTFTTGGAGGAGGSELAQVALLANFAQQGMVLVTLPRNTPGFAPDGMAWGSTWATGTGADNLDEHQHTAAQAQGKLLAEVTKKLRGNVT